MTSEVSEAERETTPTRPGRSRCAGITPILQRPGLRMPWEFGPMSRVLDPERRCFTLTMSRTGMRSVTQTTSGSSASIASMSASAAEAGGTKTAEAVAPVALTASATLSKTGRPRWRCPPLPGTTPPTTWVP